MAKRLIGKKGSIPVINELVMTFLHTVPKPILAFLFIFLISVIASWLMPTLLGMFGYTCAQHNGITNLYQIPGNQVLNNVFMNLESNLNTVFNIKQYQLPENPFPNGDKRFLKIPEECFKQSKFNSSLYGYSSGCVTCNTDAPWYAFITPIDQVCISDGYSKYTQGSIHYTNVNSFCNVCEPPPPYYFNYTNCLNNPVIADGQCYFTILNESYVSSLDVYYLEEMKYRKVKNMGGVVKAQDSSEFSNIQCDASENPNLYFFSIQVFDKTLWIILYISYWLIYFAWVWYGMVGLNR